MYILYCVVCMPALYCVYYVVIFVHMHVLGIYYSHFPITFTLHSCFTNSEKIVTVRLV